jgi:hypothetical protein
MAMEGNLQAILECLLAVQEKMKADIKDESKAAYAEMKARAEARHERFLARLDGLTSHGKERRPVRQRRRRVQEK